MNAITSVIACCDYTLRKLDWTPSMGLKKERLDFEIEKFRIEIEFRQKELDKQAKIQNATNKAKLNSLITETSRKRWESIIPWVAAILSAVVTVLTVTLTNNQREKERIASESARLSEAIAQRISDDEGRKARLDELRLERETQLVLQATRDVESEQARENIRFLAQLGYLSQSVEEIDIILDGGFTLQTSSEPVQSDSSEVFYDTVVDSFGDWSIFVPIESVSCYIASRPLQSSATRNNSPISVRRGDVRLYVYRTLSDNVIDQVSFGAGYQMGQTIATITVGSSEFDLYPINEIAWPKSDEVDFSIISEFKTNQTAAIEATSLRGTITYDEFSLDGFNEAIAKLEELCPS